MKLTLITLASLWLTASAWAIDQSTMPPGKGGTPAPEYPTLQLPTPGTEQWSMNNWPMNNWISPKDYSLFQSGPIGGKYWITNGKRVGVRSEYLVKRDLNAARISYLELHPEQAAANLLKAALMLQEDAHLANPTVREELQSCAIALEREAELIASGHAEPINQMIAVIHRCRQAASDFDYDRFSSMS
jgi:hypothetical protein